MRAPLLAFGLAVGASFAGCGGPSRARAPSTSHAAREAIDGLDILEVERRWKASPPLEHDAFWRDPSLLVTHPTNGRIQVTLVPIFADAPEALMGLPVRDFTAIPLAAYLASRPPAEIGTGDHLIVTNLRGERVHLTRSELAEHKPLLVIGLDDERNLYRIATSYRLKRAYSWREAAPPPRMIRPVGPFLFFPDGPPADVNDMAVFGLTPASFRFVTADPLAITRDLAPELRDGLAGRDGCLHCHSLRSAGARAFHVRASDGKPAEGIALPLEEYPRGVLHRFLFEQDAVAASFGVEPLPIPQRTATALYEFVTKNITGR